MIEIILVMETEIPFVEPPPKTIEPVTQIIATTPKPEPPSIRTYDEMQTNTDEFDDFANFLAKVMRKMSKSQSRKLQVNIMNLISEIEDE